MPRYIDADLLKKNHLMSDDCNNCEQYPRSCQFDYNYTKMDFCEWIDDEPTADVVDRARYKQLLENSTIMADALKEYEKEDVVEVVRCKDCVHCADDWNGNQPMFTCELAKCGESVYPTDYCSCGERREDE